MLNVRSRNERYFYLPLRARLTPVGPASSESRGFFLEYGKGCQNKCIILRDLCVICESVKCKMKNTGNVKCKSFPPSSGMYPPKKGIGESHHTNPSYLFSYTQPNNNPNPSFQFFTTDTINGHMPSSLLGFSDTYCHLGTMTYWWAVNVESDR
jgi:hypothetical protein